MIESPKGRLIAIGDIHGHSKYLNSILDSISPTKDDAFVFLGDFVDRGPDSKGVIDSIIELSQEFKVYSIAGNHEEMMLGAYAGGKEDINFWCKFGGKEALQSYGIEHPKNLPYDHIEFIKNCSNYIESENHIFVHARCNPNLHPSKNDPFFLRWQKININDPPHVSGKKIICGHSCQTKILNLGHIICIDTGAGVLDIGRLTALDVKSGTFWQFGVNYKKVMVKSLEGVKKDD